MIYKVKARMAIAVITLLVSAAAFAHNGMEHVMGTVTALSGKSVTVETVQHKTATVVVDSSTTFTHNEGPASAADLKVGDRVVIHAKMNANKQLVGSTITWGTSKPAQARERK